MSSQTSCGSPLHCLLVSPLPDKWILFDLTNLYFDNDINRSFNYTTYLTAMGSFMVCVVALLNRRIAETADPPNWMVRAVFVCPVFMILLNMWRTILHMTYFFMGCYYPMAVLLADIVFFYLVFLKEKINVMWNLLAATGKKPTRQVPVANGNLQQVPVAANGNLQQVPVAVANENLPSPTQNLPRNSVSFVLEEGPAPLIPVMGPFRIYSGYTTSSPAANSEPAARARIPALIISSSEMIRRQPMPIDRAVQQPHSESDLARFVDKIPEETATVNAVEEPDPESDSEPELDPEFDSEPEPSSESDSEPEPDPVPEPEQKIKATADKPADKPAEKTTTDKPAKKATADKPAKKATRKLVVSSKRETRSGANY